MRRSEGLAIADPLILLCSDPPNDEGAYYSPIGLTGVP